MAAGGREVAQGLGRDVLVFDDQQAGTVHGDPRDRDFGDVVASDLLVQDCSLLQVRSATCARTVRYRTR